MINGVLFGIINNYSLVYSELQKRLIAQGESEASSKAGKIPLSTTISTISTTYYGFLNQKIDVFSDSDHKI